MLTLVRHLLAASWVAAAVGGCSADSDAPSTPILQGTSSLRLLSDSQVAIDVRSVGSIVRGSNVLIVSFPDVLDAKLVAVSTFMPAHGHGGPSPTIAIADNAYRAEKVVLYMTGRWELTLQLERNGTPDKALFAVDVP